MFYSLLKRYARFAIKIYCTKIVVNKPEVLKSKGPLLFASNHPNSFLDGMILTTLLDEALYSLARGDAFKNTWVNKLLRKLKLLPVYRTSEGVENLEHNYTTFDACRETFKENGMVLIFSEGKCENEWHLRPLKKGTARLSITSWKMGIPLTVLPTAFNYSSFRKFGKEVHLLFGEPVNRNEVLQHETDGKLFLSFNEQLNSQLKQLVYEIKPGDKQTVRKVFPIKIDPSFYFLMLPAVVGWALHAPLFYSCKLFAVFFKNTGHYDSVLASTLLLLYPFYFLLLALTGFTFNFWVGLLLIPLLPFSAWACTQAKYQLGL
ncbi:MAG TPA: 1-acyl-sn-glycerol-3-phosphate acyltransferase [Flavisolibacter sp.]|nr:1-acyl-sn-glycerol-3-phosphate acyltransferase [Flavisolibacter sp.]